MAEALATRSSVLTKNGQSYHYGNNEMQQLSNKKGAYLYSEDDEDIKDIQQGKTKRKGQCEVSKNIDESLSVRLRHDLSIDEPGHSSIKSEPKLGTTRVLPPDIPTREECRPCISSVDECSQETINVDRGHEYEYQKQKRIKFNKIRSCFTSCIPYIFSTIAMVIAIVAIFLVHQNHEHKDINVTQHVNKSLPKFVNLYIDWDKRNSRRPQTEAVNITWADPQHGLVRLSNNKQCIYVNVEGDYHFILTLGLHHDAKNTSIIHNICIRNSHPKKEKCSKHTTGPETFESVTVHSVTSLTTSACSWVSIIGVKYLYPVDELNEFIILKLN